MNRLVWVLCLLVVLSGARAPSVAQARAHLLWTAEEIGVLIDQSAAEFGVSNYWMGRVLWCESGWNPGATNPYSGTAGIAQYTWPTFWGNVYSLWWPPGTWISPYNPAVAVRLMAYMWSRGQARQWTCSYLVGYLK